MLEPSKIDVSKILDQVVYCPNCFNPLVKFSPEVYKDESGVETLMFTAQDTLIIEGVGEVKCTVCNTSVNLYREVEKL